VRGRPHCRGYVRNRPATPVLTVPTNVWTREEFEAWIAENVNEALSERHPSAAPATEQEIAELMRVMVSEVNYAIMPAGNA
jgi:hypothetical protein